MKYPKFSHKTPHLKGKQHQLDPNLDIKQLVHHSIVQYVDRDADGDVDVYDAPKKKTPDENPTGVDAQTLSKKLIAKQKGEIKHTKVGLAYEGNLHKWFKSSSSKEGKPGWVNVVTGGTCASDEPGEGTPKCVSSAKRASMTPAERRSAARRKKAADPGQQQKTGAAKPTYVSTDSPKMKKEEIELQEVKDKPGKGSGKKDACYHKVKSRYSVWPSAYASGALVKCRKVGANNWGTKTEEMHMHDEERYCPLCKKRESRSECSYGEKAWDKVSVKDEEYSMVRSELSTIVDAVRRLKAKVENGEGNLEAWVQSKITKAADYIDTAADYVVGGEMEEGLSYSIDKSTHRAAQKREKIRNIVTRGSTEGERSAASGKLGSVAELPSIKKEENSFEEMKCWPGYKKKGTQTLFGKKYNRCVKKEDVTIEDANGNTFAEVIDIVKTEPIKGFKSQVEESVRIPAKTGNIILVTLNWKGKYYSLKIFFPQTTKPNRKEVQDQIEKVYPGSKVQSYYVSEIKPGEQFLQVEDWQKVNRQDKTDGLSQKAVNAYRKENPGSKLQTAVTEKNPSGKRADRRKSFCRRMKGMKKRLTSAETARDPDSRINKALRRWNCN